MGTHRDQPPHLTPNHANANEPSASNTFSAKNRYKPKVHRVGTPSRPKAGFGSKSIMIHGLAANVSRVELRDMMQSTIGPVESVQMDGGTAWVVFKRFDGFKAKRMYEGMVLDGSEWRFGCG
jgi:hypothetical protein